MSIKEMGINELYTLQANLLKDIQSYLTVISPMRIDGKMLPDCTVNDNFRSKYMRSYENNIELIQKVSEEIDVRIEHLNQRS